MDCNNLSLNNNNSQHHISSIPVEPDYKRKPNFTDMEKLYLLQQYGIYKPILSSKLCDGATTRQKQDTWNQIAIGLNQQNPTVERTAKEVKKKWENLATLARKEIAEFRSGTGRSLLRPPSALTLKILELIDDISFNNPPSDGSFAVVKEEIWDDDTDSAEMSPSNVHSSNESASLQQTFNSSNNNQISSYSSTSSNNTVIPPYEAPAPLPVQAPAPVARPFVGHSFSLNNNNPNNKRPFTPQDDFCFDLYSLKKRKLHLESEKLELENEKLRLEMDILRLKFNSMKKQRGDPTVIIADDDGDNYNNKEESVEDSDTSRQ